MSGSRLVRAFPHPVLEEGNLSFPEGQYSPEIDMGADGYSATVRHFLQGAPLIARLLEEGDAFYACTVSIPVTSYRRLLCSESRDQMIQWDQSYVGEPAILHPVIVCRRKLQCDLSSDDGVNEAWVGHKVILEPGSKIVLGPFFRTSTSLQSLLSVRKDTRLEPGQLSVEACSEDGYYFDVRVAADLHEFLQRWGGEERKLHRDSILTHAISRCFELLVKYFGNEGDGDEEWRSYRNLVALASELESRGLPLWDADGFIPEKVATSLQPHQISYTESDST